jgi:hypothetical protein
MIDRLSLPITVIGLLFFNCTIVYYAGMFGYEHQGWTGAILGGISSLAFLIYGELLLLGNLLNFIFFTFCCVVAYYGGKFGYGYNGWIGAICGAISSVVLTIFVLRLIALPNYRPNCDCGKNIDDMDFGDTNTPAEKWGRVCSCGKKYTRQGRRWLEVMPDGSLHPFMKARFFKWISDRDK